MPNTVQRSSFSSSKGVREFCPRRIGWLIRNRIFQDLVPLGMGSALILVVNLIVMLFPPHRAFFNHVEGIPWVGSVVVACCILAASAFRDMQSGKSETHWILLPATVLEKYLAALIEMILLIPIAAMTLATVCSGLLFWIENLAGGQGGKVWTFFDFNGLAPLGFLVVLTAFILPGATVFRKQILLKSLSFLSVYVLAFNIQTTIIFEMLARLKIHGGVSMKMQIAMGNMYINHSAAPAWLISTFSNFFTIHFFVITPLCALAFAYFRVREKEAKDAVQ